MRNKDSKTNKFIRRNTPQPFDKDKMKKRDVISNKALKPHLGNKANNFLVKQKKYAPQVNVMKFENPSDLAQAGLTSLLISSYLSCCQLVSKCRDS